MSKNLGKKYEKAEKEQVINVGDALTDILRKAKKKQYKKVISTANPSAELFIKKVNSSLDNVAKIIQV